MRVAFFVIFLLDLAAGSIFKFNYNFKLVWWLDFVSAISMLPVENFNFDSGDGFSLNYLAALKAFKVAAVEVANAAPAWLRFILPPLNSCHWIRGTQRT